MHLSRKPPSKLVFPIRAVEDHHVDRTDVEVQQCMKLTVTNCSIGLISLRPVLNMPVLYVCYVWCVKQLTIQSGMKYQTIFATGGFR